MPPRTTTLKELARRQRLGGRPSWAELRVATGRVALGRGEWAGAPMPVHHVPLVMEPRHPFAGLDGQQWTRPGENEKEPAAVDFTVVNEWTDRRTFGWPTRVYVFREADGRTTHCMLPQAPAQRLKMHLDTLGVAAEEVWTVEAEARAVTKLRELVNPAQYRTYMLAGGFVETSKRSGVCYYFRKLRPTIAIRAGADETGGRVLAALCLHPIGYYAGTFAGVMTPTDCVMTHLIMMRADEHLFWKKSNQHAADSDGAGI